MSYNSFIIDGYVDEPACFGVPPYISPYVRYVAGVCKEHGYNPGYMNIDQIRENPALLQSAERSDLIVFISGVTVPGKYIGGRPATGTEIMQIGASLRSPLKCIGGPVVFGSGGGGGCTAVKESFSVYDHVLQGEIASALDSVLLGGSPFGEFDYSKIDRWSVLGSDIIPQHPAFPNVMCELETARGCSRAVTGGCSFCTEAFYGLPKHRAACGIHAEVSALYKAGARHFRLGRQPDLLTYGTKGGGEFPVPNPQIIEELFSGIRKVAPELKTLHIDNINPGTIARHEDESKEALSSIVRWHTSGDLAAFGLESADPLVIRENNLKAQPDDVLRAIEIVNEVGGVRDENGIPHLLPGLNFVLGLSGESEKTYDLNESFLRDVLKRDLLVRRVNIRQVMPFEGTKAYEENTIGKYEKRFRQFKEWVRNEFDLPMLKRVFPAGTVLSDLIIEVEGQTSFGRQLGSYPILAGMPLQIPKGSIIDAVVCDWGFRSVTAIPYPVKINELPASAIKKIPGIGKKKAVKIIAKRPFQSYEELKKVAEDVIPEKYIGF
ncbi:radical SAM protein [Methanoplanus sp. FWC-SCC4]|uniref:Radical SAM protein n=1 Tax=Methanochimaera problematica TaxID=2609417 RepID=A0AA97FAY1_9EURY|nr:helix-hairpin-helix domain-containing protein [Methanoplanus sp. FWC-SCC4]WOF15552.1 radical SAM protein [Methanoplanus sp. FWC-SCC4]